ncbi:MAG: hypothetical protein PSX79_14785 [bacterium]|nr:hypothetical protein [bacterium]
MVLPVAGSALVLAWYEARFVNGVALDFDGGRLVKLSREDLIVRAGARSRR